MLATESRLIELVSSALHFQYLGAQLSWSRPHYTATPGSRACHCHRGSFLSSSTGATYFLSVALALSLNNGRICTIRIDLFAAIGLIFLEGIARVVNQYGCFIVDKQSSLKAL